MPCKRSFFSPTLFKKNLTRFWPLWGLASLAGAMVPLWLLLNLVNAGYRATEIASQEFAELLYLVAADAVPFITIPYAILCAMLVWGYLMNGRAVGLMHSLPVDRTCLFLTGAASGLAMMLIPYAVTGSLVCLIALAWGFMDLTAVCLTALSVILLSVAYFGIATFCAMITGNIFMVPALYFLLDFLAPMVTALFNSLYINFFLGLTETDFAISYWLSPPIKIAQNFGMIWERVDTEASSYMRAARLEGLGTVALYALVGAALLGLSWSLYRLRHSERAGDVMVFPWLRPVFRYGAAALSALTVGRAFYSLFWEGIFQEGDWYEVVPMAVCLAVAGILGYYIASMLLEKSLRVFRGSLKGVAVVCAGVLVLSLWLGLDPFRLVTRVPDADDVAEMRASFNDRSLDLEAEADRETIEDVVALHRAVVDDRHYIMDATAERDILIMDDTWGSGITYSSEERPAYRYVWLQLTYDLKNGSTLRREYRLLVTQPRAEDPATFDGKLAALYQSPRTIREEISVPRDYALDRMTLYNDIRSVSSGIEKQPQAVLDALERDLEAGNIPTGPLFGEEPGHYALSVELELVSYQDRSDRPSYSYKSIPIYPSMTETVGLLMDLGYLSEEELTELQEGYAARYLPEDPAD